MLTHIHEIREWIAGKWTLLVIGQLSDTEIRFSRLRKKINGVSQKMLTQTLRQLERDGFVVRTVYAEVPPRVTYKLTTRGSSFGQSLYEVWRWISINMEEVVSSRQAFDCKEAADEEQPDCYRAKR
jgi:DNA-binding HxlR family transcriptional regulator